LPPRPRSGRVSTVPCRGSSRASHAESANLAKRSPRSTDKNAPPNQRKMPERCCSTAHTICGAGRQTWPYISRAAAQGTQRRSAAVAGLVAASINIPGASCAHRRSSVTAGEVDDSSQPVLVGNDAINPARHTRGARLIITPAAATHPYRHRGSSAAGLLPSAHARAGFCCKAEQVGWIGWAGLTIYDQHQVRSFGRESISVRAAERPAGRGQRRRHGRRRPKGLHTARRRRNQSGGSAPQRIQCVEQCLELGVPMRGRAAGPGEGRDAVVSA
jgi:hypothetical protein